jgi:exodeoxyribonuclease V gamma subunit
MVWRLFEAVLPDITEKSTFTPEVMTWQIMQMLPGMLTREEFLPLKRYLNDDQDGIKLYQLAGKIADTFDQYTLFRPDMLLEWESGREGEWQAPLWRELAVCGKGRHRARLRKDFHRVMETTQSRVEGIPERMSVFGISYLPQYHMEILAAISRITDVNLFLLSPTHFYWSDINLKHDKSRLKPEETVNPLLASLGKLGRDFSDMIIEMGDVAAIQKDIYTEPSGSSLLSSIQSDILNLQGAGGETKKRMIDPADYSVQIHSCHSPMREIEVLYDNILDLLEKVEGLQPRDIVVMTPEIEKYASYIAAVFEGCQDPCRKIPFSIADRKITNEGQVAAVLLKLLGIPRSRLTVPQVVDILESAPVSRRFNLEEDELETVRLWVEETRIRWGMDEDARARLGLPGYRDNSWRAGLDRLLLGYSMSEEKGRLFNGTLPYGEIEGSQALTLGKFAEFIARIESVAERLDSPRTLYSWRDEFRSLLSEFIETDDELAREMDAVTKVVDSLGELTEAGFDDIVGFDVISAWISGRLEGEEKGLGFMTGEVTFCAMLPMRSIPFRVVALIGMNDGAFPRQGRPPGFDLIARNPRRGDRSLRDEDRYLFLEAILSARDCLYISYVGQSVKDNSEIPPSVVVSELLDGIDKGYSAGENTKIGDRLVTGHRLQAFSSDYFSNNTSLFSYSDENCSALIEKRTSLWQPGEFLTTPLAEPTEEWRDVPLIRLQRFFVNPARFFLENRLGIRLEDAASSLEDREPFDIGHLDAYTLKQELLELFLQGGDMAGLLPVARSRGILPPARHGLLKFSAAADEVREFAAVVKGKCTGAPLAPLDFELDLEAFRLTGRLDHIWPDRMVRYRCAKLKAKDQIRAWIEHLVLNVMNREGYPRDTLLLMTGGSRTSFRPVEDARAILLKLMELYWEGLMKPLRFYPESSMEYGKKQEWKLERARKKWEAGFNTPGEGEDPYFRLCFGRVDPFTADFERVSRSFLEPLHQHLA